MAKSPALIGKLKSFADKLSGTSHIDNKTNPASAYSMNKRKDASMGPAPKFTKKQETFGVPGVNKQSKLPKSY